MRWAPCPAWCSVAGSPSSEPLVEGLFTLELIWLPTPFPKNSFGWEYELMPSLCTHAFHCTNSKDPDIHVLDRRMLATKMHPACTIHEHRMWTYYFIHNNYKTICTAVLINLHQSTSNTLTHAWTIHDVATGIHLHSGQRHTDQWEQHTDHSPPNAWSLHDYLHWSPQLDDGWSQTVLQQRWDRRKIHMSYYIASNRIYRTGERHHPLLKF